jgi:hypothetical protein
MKFLAMLLPLTAVVLAIPSKRGECTTPQVRVEWRSLTQDQRDSYHSATKCLQNKPSGVEGQSLYDRFAQNHVDMFGGSALFLLFSLCILLKYPRSVHYVAAFLAVCVEHPTFSAFL